MNIALITSMKYGLTQFIFRDVKALSDKGHNVRLFTLHNVPGLYNPLPEWELHDLSRGKILIEQLKFIVRHPILYLQILYTAIRTNSLVNMMIAVTFSEQVASSDIIFSYFGDHKFLVGYYCKRITGIPLTVTVRAYELHDNPNVTLFKEALQYCDRIITITEFNKSMLIDKYDAPADKIDIVRQIVNLDLFKPYNKTKILIVGFFAEKKGHEILFKALKSINREDIELWVVGDVNVTVNAVDCRQLAKDLGIESQVAFFGAQRDAALRVLYNECDIFCLPSRIDSNGDHEGFPNVIAEAMAFGKPIISTYHAGIPEALDQVALVEESNVEQLAEALLRVCDSPELRSSLGQQNRERVEEMFSLANNDKLEGILERYSNRSDDSDSKPNNLPIINVPS